MIRVAICDDIEIWRQELKEHLLEYGQKYKVEYCFYEYENGTKMLADDKEYDLVFLDYQFNNDKGNDGITIAMKLREKQRYVKIIFLSAYSHIVFDTFDVGTFRFLKKTINSTKLEQAMDAFLKTLEEDLIVPVKVQGVSRFLHASDIVYLEGFGKYCIIHMFSGEVIECHETLAMLETRVPATSFYRCHKSFVVNMAYVQSFHQKAIELTTKDEVLISRKKYKEFGNVHLDYIIAHR